MTTITGTPTVPQPARTDAGGTSETEKAFMDFRSVMAEQYQQWRALPEDQKHRHIYLDKHDMSESDLALLPTQDQLVHEQKIAEVSNQPLTSPTPPAERMEPGKAWTSAVVTLQSVLQTVDPADLFRRDELADTAALLPFAEQAER
jgi:uncharacterized protein involved in copper resistance